MRPSMTKPAPIVATPNAVGFGDHEIRRPARVQHDIRPVGRLFCFRRPSAVFRRVVQRSILPINGKAVHVAAAHCPRFEILVVRKPRINFDPLPAIPRVAVGFRVAASIPHARPSSVKTGSRFAVGLVDIDSIFLRKASAGSRSTSLQVGRPHVCFGAAITDAAPHGAPPLVLGSMERDESAEPDACQIFECHMNIVAEKTRTSATFSAMLHKHERAAAFHHNLSAFA